MKKLISIAIGASIVATTAICVHAASNDLNYYISNGGYDFLGWKGEDLYFKLRDAYAHGNPLKILRFDVMNLKLQGLMTIKNISDNDLIYMWFGGYTALVKLKGGMVLLKLLKFIH
jgi:hypothetical protein